MRPYTFLLIVPCGCPGGIADKERADTDSAIIDSDSRASVDDTAPCLEQVWHTDYDGDGYGDATTEARACDAPEGGVADGTDCDDSQSTVYPGAREVCGDGIVNDCEDTDGSAAAAACPPAGPYEFSAADGRLLGEGEGDYAGWSVSGAGDADGDGHDDLLVGAPYALTAYRVMGPVSGTISLGSSATRVTASGGAGWSIANAGDQDGDGLPDMLVGVAQGGEDDEGQALLVLGTTMGDLSLADVDAVLTGESEDDAAGQSVAGLSDMDGDGWDDLAVGAISVTGSSVESTLGECGDADWEEYGREHGVYAGAVYMLRGPVSGDMSLAMADARVVGEDGADYLGYRLGGQGDLNGDGVPDLLMSAVGQCEGGLDAGAIYVMEGPVSGDISAAAADRKVLGAARRELAGQALSVAGDVNGDGYGDFVVGERSKSGSEGDFQGVVYMVLGPGSGVSELAGADSTMWGERASDEAGYSVGSAGDLDMDGFDDLIVGALLESSVVESGGAVYVVHGPVSGTSSLRDADIKMTGAEEGAGAGGSVAGVGDVDSDGLPDLLVGATGDSEGAFAAGAAYLILGGGPILTGGYGP